MLHCVYGFLHKIAETRLVTLSLRNTSFHFEMESNNSGAAQIPLDTLFQS